MYLLRNAININNHVYMSSITIDKTENMEPAIRPRVSNKYTDLQLLKLMGRSIGY